MGSNHSSNSSKSGKSSPTEQQVSNAPRKSISRTTSGTDINDKPDNYSEPLQKLAKILTEKAINEENIKGISETIFTKYLFSRYPSIGEKLFKYLHKLSKSKVNYIGKLEFMKQCDHFLHILDEEQIRILMVQIFASCNDTDAEVSQDTLTSLLMSCYHVSMDHYADGPQMCLGSQRTLAALVTGCFHGKEILSAQYVSHWLELHCPRLLQPLHRYLLHALATAWRQLQDDSQPEHLAKGLELATPVLEQGPPFSAPGGKHHQRLLSMSMAWVLAGALPPLYSRPTNAPSPSNSAIGLSSHAFLARFMCAVPSHWLTLYSSDEMGLGVNRFLHHTLHYRGATLVLIKANNGETNGKLFCIACPNEWRESHQYWGTSDTAIFQLYPTFQLLESAPKSLYLNTSVRGYPLGLRAGSDPRKPILSIDGGFEKLEYSKIPYPIITVEVWGCGDTVQAAQQQDHKKWEVKEAERQRDVKLSADDWLDHPDRYLLQLGGRPNYTNK